MIAPNSQQRHGFGDRHMHFFRGVNHSLGCTVIPFLVGGGPRLASHGQPHKVGGRASAGEVAVEPLASNRFREPSHDGSFDGDRGRSRTPGRDVLIEHAGQQVGHCADGVPRAQHVAEEAPILSSAVAYEGFQTRQRAFAQSLFRQISAEKLLRRGASAFWKNGTRVERIHIFDCYLSNRFCQPAELLRGDFKRVHGGRFYTD